MRSDRAEIVKGKFVGCTHSLSQKVALVIAPGHFQQEMARLARCLARLEDSLLAELCVHSG